jgi:hypothetical protein
MLRTGENAMTFPLKDNLLHQGMPWQLANELENQVTSPNFSTLFGGSLAINPLGLMNESGNLYRNIGNPIAGNGADTTLDILAGIQLQAGAFDILGRGLMVSASGKFGATVSGNVVISLYINPTMSGQTVTNGVISGGTVTSTGSGVIIGTQALTAGAGVIVAANGWQLLSQFFKYGAAGANTQYSQSAFINGTGATLPHTGIQAPVFSTIAENAAMNLVLAASSSNSTANEVILNCFEVTGFN